jgi:DMSO/TMAO reductase YedYZ molybdopterin-dependent catalytic subunit
MRKFFVLLAGFFAVLIAASCTPAPTATPVPPPPTQVPVPTKTPFPPVLKLEGSTGTKSLTLDEMKALPSVEGWAGIKSSTGKITVPERYKGVALAELGKLVGGIVPNTGVTLTAKDGYAMTISYDQIAQGEFILYDPGTGDEVKIKETLTVIIAYEKEGKPLSADADGPLKLVVISAKNNQVVDGHWAVKWINQIAIKPLAQEWKLLLGGAISEEMDRGTFQSCAAPACHGKTWTDEKAQVWSGVPLWWLAGRVDDENKHGDSAYNEKVADKGYEVHIVSVDGTKIVLDAARVKRNPNLLVAYLVNNNPLPEKDAPLRLVGSDLKSNEMLGRISKINLMIAQVQAPTATPKPAATTAPAATSASALTLTGAVEKTLTLTLDALKAMTVIKLKAEHPKQGMQEYEGIRLIGLLDQAKVKESATKLVMTSADGFVSEVALADVKKCADCLIAFRSGKLDAVMPGMASNFWAKDVVKIEAK